ncbi:MAG: type I-C CRISPR-associated protein Cas8c/Csd1 [Dehalococcoidales bacterium]|nr:type I-C CRISPR-associated protein Cas8c/Csd1 [Dehalococcoidales bacterium]
MLLQRLSEYAGRLDLPPTLYAQTPVRYIVELDARGVLLSRQPVDTADPAQPRAKFGQRYLMPQVQRSSGIKPLLFVGNAEYTLGLPRDPAKAARTAACHRAYVALVERCAGETGEPAVAAVLAFLQSDPASLLDLGENFSLDANITFRVDGAFPTDLPRVQAFWAALNDPGAGDKEPTVMQCLVCGQERPVLARLQEKIKGIPGGQMAGTALVSANAKAFESYGLEASFIAPSCAGCGERFTKAANDLLAKEATHYVLGGAAFVFWTREDNAFSLRTFLDDPKTEEVRALLAAVHSPRPLPEVDSTAFYAAVLSASGGRAVVRDWLDTTVVEVKRQLALWFSRQNIVDDWGREHRPLGLYHLAAATVRDPAKELAPPTMRTLLHAAVAGTPLPTDLLVRAVRRNRAEQAINHRRASLIKLVLSSREPQAKEDRMVRLDPGNVNPAYLCGRLLAVLEEAQVLAVPGAKATIVDRFFGTASTAPASVFGRLLRGAQPHLAKLKRDRPGAHRAIQVRLEEVQAGLDGFPRILALADQGRFAIGYYHQRAFDRAQALAAKERRQAGLAAATEDDLSLLAENENTEEEK